MLNREHLTSNVSYDNSHDDADKAMYRQRCEEGIDLK